MRLKLLCIAICTSYTCNFAQVDTTNNVELFGQIWGLLKFYNPDFQTGKINCDTFFLDNYSKFKYSKSNEDFNFLLDSVLRTLKSINPKKNKSIEIENPNNINVNWISDNSILNKSNKEKLKNFIYYYKPRSNKNIKKEKCDYSFSQIWETPVNPPDESESVLAFFNYWNRINYFFAYKELMDENWDSILHYYLPLFMSINRDYKFYSLLAELTTKINDGHSFYYNKYLLEKQGVPLFIGTEILENSLYISNIIEDISKITGLKNGDKIISFRNNDVDTLINDKKKITGGSTYESRNISVSYNILTSDWWYDTIQMKVIDSLGIVKDIFFIRDSMYNNTVVNHFRANNKPAYRNIDDKIGYIDISKTNLKSINKAFREFSKKDAILIDLRGYGGVPIHFLTMHFSKKKIPYAHLYVRNDKFPGTYKSLIYKTNPFNLSLFKKKYKGKIVVLIDEHTGSGMELEAMLLRALNCTLIGRNTGGYDGSCICFKVRNDFCACYSGDKVLYPNGSQTQRIGIVPDIYIERQFQDIVSCSDEILNRAIKFVYDTEK